MTSGMKTLGFIGVVLMLLSWWGLWHVWNKDTPEEDWFMDWQLEQPIWVIEGCERC